MRLRLLLTLGIVLCMATIASSNESRRFCGHVSGSKAVDEATGTGGTTTPAQSESAEYSTLLVNKLLYI